MELEEYYDFFVWKENMRQKAVHCHSLDKYEKWLKDEEAVRAEYERECRHFCYQQKHDDIVKALRAIRASGHEARLANFTNSCITANSKRGAKLTYFACSGTIQGYGGTNVHGIDCFIKLLDEI
jgi:hypothetical protein